MFLKRFRGSILTFAAVFVLTIGCNESSSQQAKLPVSGQEPIETEVITETRYCVDELGRALGGYDPLSYYADSAGARLGHDEFAYSWGGAQWYFFSAEHLQLFKSDPEKYAPANGGYCTFGIVLKKKLEADPRVWLLKDKKLYMFLSKEVRAQFLLDEAGNLSKVAQNWPDMAQSLL